ncbi:TPA: hypothetical protein MH640_09995 [Klebsiella pneumoniae]|nr:hypothetical protein [Klebsiella pneumoniae]HBZ0657074.1 hypothetical protein [Klebsiella pneumoniae]HBZ0842501.1 hypothetical protein [Klebsiella pneumoniae]
MLSRFPGLCVDRRCSTLVHATTKRALPVSESNGPFPCPSPDIELSWRLESNQTLCLARQCPHRCVPESSRASHLFAVLVGRTACLKHLACTWRRQDDIVHQTHLILGFA